VIHMVPVSNCERWLLCLFGHLFVCPPCQPIIEVESLLELFFSAKPFPARILPRKLGMQWGWGGGGSGWFRAADLRSRTSGAAWSSGPGFALHQQELALAKNPDVKGHD
jgi:hypothetical protein